MITIQNLSKSFGDNTIFNNYNLNILQGDRILLKGNSGVGKTTLVRCIAGLEKYEGCIKRTGTLFYIFQENRFMPWLTNLENILLPFRLQGIDVETKKATLWRLAIAFGVNKYIEKYPEEVSGGELQRMSILQGLLFFPDVLILDEPFKGLDRQLYIKLYQYILDWAKQNNRTLIYISHAQEKEQDWRVVPISKKIYI